MMICRSKKTYQWIKEGILPKKISSFVIFVGIWAVLLVGCSLSQPKPKGYIRFDFPQRTDSSFSFDNYPFVFGYNAEAVIAPHPQNPYWFNLVYPQYHATIYFTYHPLTKGDWKRISADNRRLLERHKKVAKSIHESLYCDPSKKKYIMVYDLQGDVMSNMQFEATDSLRHYLRASLYIDAVPNRDSLAPLVNHLREDMLQIIETLHWK